LTSAAALHRHAVENANQADALLFARVAYGLMEARVAVAGADRSEVEVDASRIPLSFYSKH
jgi:hypothetical protein